MVHHLQPEIDPILLLKVGDLVEVEATQVDQEQTLVSEVLQIEEEESQGEGN